MYNASDSVDRMVTCLRVLGTAHGNEAGVQAVWLEACRRSFTIMIQDKQTREAEELKHTV